MENINEQFNRLFCELDLTDDQAAMVKKLQRDVNAALRQPPVICRASKIKEARDIAGKIFMLYDEKNKTGHWELDKATDAIYAYIKELGQS